MERVIDRPSNHPRLQVVARASSRETEEKLLRAGADRVVTPYTIGGQRMALGLLQPAVNELLNSVVFDAEKHTELGEIEVREHVYMVYTELQANSIGKIAMSAPPPWSAAVGRRSAVHARSPG